MSMDRKKFRKKPRVIEAYQTDVPLLISTLEGEMKAEKGDWIITGLQGEQYPCKPDIFAESYEPAEVWEGDQIAAVYAAWFEGYTSGAAGIPIEWAWENYRAALRESE